MDKEKFIKATLALISTKNGWGVRHKIDLEKEVQRIEAKKSKLSSSQRRMVLNLWEYVKGGENATSTLPEVSPRVGSGE